MHICLALCLGILDVTVWVDTIAVHPPRRMVNPTNILVIHMPPGKMFRVGFLLDQYFGCLRIVSKVPRSWVFQGGDSGETTLPVTPFRRWQVDHCSQGSGGSVRPLAITVVNIYIYIYVESSVDVHRCSVFNSSIQTDMVAVVVNLPSQCMNSEVLYMGTHKKNTRPDICSKIFKL